MPKFSLKSINATYKLPAAILLSFGIASLQDYAWAAFALVVALGFSFFSGLHRKQIWTALLALNIFSVFVLLTIPWQSGTLPKDEILTVFANLSYTTTGLLKAITIVIKSNAIMLVTLSMLCTSSVTQNAAAMLRFGIPAKLVTLLLLVSRHMESFIQQTTRMQQAAKLRGFSPNMHPKHWKISAYFIAMLLINAFDKSKRTEQAMRLRGFTGTFPILLEQKDAPQIKGSILLFSSLGLFCLFIITKIWT